MFGSLVPGESWDSDLGKSFHGIQGLGKRIGRILESGSVSRCCYNNLPNFMEHCSFLLLALPFAYVGVCAWNDLLLTVSTVLTQSLGLSLDIASSRKASMKHPATPPLGKCLCRKPCMYPYQRRCHNQLPPSCLLLQSSCMGWPSVEHLDSSLHPQRPGKPGMGEILANVCRASE